MSPDASLSDKPGKSKDIWFFTMPDLGVKPHEGGVSYTTRHQSMHFTFPLCGPGSLSYASSLECLWPVLPLKRIPPH